MSCIDVSRHASALVVLVNIETRPALVNFPFPSPELKKKSCECAGPTPRVRFTSEETKRKQFYLTHWSGFD